MADTREFQVAVIRIQPAWLKEHAQSTTVVPAPQFGCGRGETAVSDQEDATRLACLPAVAALVEAAAAEYATLLDDAGLDTAPPADALARFLDAGWRFVDRYPLLLTAPAARIPRPENDPHDFVPPRLERLIERGRHTGDFAPSLPAAWLAAAVLGLQHTAVAQVGTRRLTAQAAAALCLDSALRLCGGRAGTARAGHHPTT
ncbi:hypothetical protein [Streptomyces sasae]|uniref:hypothetical protein n=1 Tax=Streptomyces sasae TaxID=1266772 RepID=UPI0029304B4F|nr:hypothetical protein [Streptomyces sasae]